MRVLFLTTGGTIAGNTAGPSDFDRLTAIEVEAVAAKAAQRIKAIWNIDVEVDTREVANLDSSDVTPEMWTDIALTVRDEYGAHDAFIVTHGTNTMGYTAAALSFAIANSRKPVIVTGSQVPYQAPGSDAAVNIENAVRIAAYPYRSIGGVVVVFGSHLIAGTRAKKTTEFDLDAFQTFSAPSLGRIGRTFEIVEERLARHQAYLTTRQTMAVTANQLVVQPNFRMSGIMSLTEFPGLSSDRLIAAAEAWGAGGGLDGVIFRAFGAGDASVHRLPFFEYLRDREIPVVVTTQAANGKSTLTVNAPGRYLHDHDLAIAAHDMSIEAMTTKLGWLLAQDHTYADIRRLMIEDLRGEINVVPDDAW